MIKETLAILGGAALVIMFFVVVDKLCEASRDHDVKVQEAAQAYEDCVIKEYGGRSVMEIYYATGEYPVCKAD